MKKIVFAALIVALSFSCVFAGGKKEAAEPAKPVEEKKVTEVTTGPKYGGTLNAAVESEPLLLDNHLQMSNVIVAVSDVFNDFLWRWNGDFTEMVPHLATSWEWIDDTHFKVNLRKGVKFHNGREVKAGDVKYSIDRVKDPNTGSPSAVFLEPIKEVVVHDDYSCTFVLNYPWFGLMDRMTYIAIVPKEAVEKYGDLKTHPVGCGPFVFESLEPGLQVTATKFEDYWMEGRPYLDRVVIKFMPVYNTAKNALLRGEIDIIFWPEPADYESLRDNPDLDLFIYSQLVGMYVAMNTQNKPLDNKLVRKAVALAISRDKFNKGLYKGLGKLCWVPILPSQKYYTPDWEYKRDVNKAKEVLAQAGYPNGFQIRILAPKGAEEIMGEILYSDLKDIGIEGKITALEIPEFLDALLNKEDFDFAVLGDTISPDPDFFASKYLVPNGSMASIVGHWGSRANEVRALLDEGRKTIDMDKRVEIYRELYDIVLDENPMVFVTYGTRLPVFKNFVKDFFAYGDIRYNWEEIWLDK
jgi:peptide/nickel transport system substrate-binding protein